MQMVRVRACASISGPAIRSLVAAALLAAAATLAPAHLARAKAPRLAHAYVHGVINPIKARYLARVIEDARKQGASALLLSIDTPGGLVSSMQDIVQQITNAPFPVIGLVEPSTAQATSAGALLLLATDVAAMLPDTRVGAAHPVGAGEPLRGAMEKKATNSLASLARSLATRRDRSAEAAEAMVRKSVSYTAAEALDKRIIELIVPSRSELLRLVDGRTVERAGKTVTLRTQGAKLVDARLSWSERILDAAADPTLASLLLTIGVLGILYELSSPGIGLGGIVGVTALVVALLAMSVLPLRIAGIALLLAGLAAIALEVKTPAHGLLGLGGIAAITVGAIVLIDEGGYFGALPQIRWSVFAPVLVLSTVGVIALARVVSRSQQPPPRVGVEALPGARGRARGALTRSTDGWTGSVFVDGARWPAIAEHEVAAGDPVEVVAVESHPTRLRVRRLTPSDGET